MISTKLVTVGALYDTCEFMGTFSVTSNMYPDDMSSDATRIDINHRLEKLDMTALEILIANTVQEFLKAKDESRRFQWLISLSDEEKLEMLNRNKPESVKWKIDADWVPMCKSCYGLVVKPSMIHTRYGFRCRHCSNEIGFDLKPVVVPKTWGIDLTLGEE